ncbi:MAG: squalene/phytoene synthase family protein [Elusimicrobiaceae bacterium]|nr:squalene/phytoene synthase family protein [Elusimicrobiaceae bacterium]
MTAKRPESGSSFRPAFLFLSTEKRDALSAVYGYCRAVDDAVDEPGGQNPRDLVRFWREETGRLYESRPTHPVTKALLEPVRQFGLKKEHLLLVLNGVALDLDVYRYETFDDLKKYMFGVASAVAHLCLSIFGYTATDRDAMCENMGYSVQLTNIIRDVASDSSRGRIYLPLEDLRRFGVSEAEVLDRQLTPNLRALLQFESARAKEYYRVTRTLIAPQDRGRLFSCSVMSAVYEAVLDKITARDYDVFHGKVKLNGLQKLKAFYAAWRVHD